MFYSVHPGGGDSEQRIPQDGRTRVTASQYNPRQLKHDVLLVNCSIERLFVCVFFNVRLERSRRAQCRMSPVRRCMFALFVFAFFVFSHQRMAHLGAQVNRKKGNVLFSITAEHCIGENIRSLLATGGQHVATSGDQLWVAVYQETFPKPYTLYYV